VKDTSQSAQCESSAFLQATKKKKQNRLRLEIFLFFSVTLGKKQGGKGAGGKRVGLFEIRNQNKERQSVRKCHIHKTA
jgi:hypothetical protein